LQISVVVSIAVSKMGMTELIFVIHGMKVKIIDGGWMVSFLRHSIDRKI